MRLLTIIFLCLLLVGCSEQHSLHKQPEIVPEIEEQHVACEAGQEYLEEEMICALPVTCEKEMCAAFGDGIISKLEQTYGSLIDEESISTDESLQVIASYTIDLDEEWVETDDDVSQAQIDNHADLWFDFAWLIPEYERLDIDTFEVFESGDTLAYVYINNPEQFIGRWTLGINEENIELASETMLTYIHEFAHVLSMRDEQVDYYADEQQCEGVWIEDVCFYEHSFIAHYYKAFYTDEQPETLDHYVSEYAMSDVTEDFAETFAHFILTSEPTTTRVADDKVRFFYRYTYFIELRAHILRRAATWLEASVAVE